MNEEYYLRLINKVNSYGRQNAKTSFLEEAQLYIRDSLIRDEQKIEYALGKLNPRELEIIKLRCGFEGKPRTLEQISERFSRTPERIRSIESGALRKFRKFYNNYNKLKEHEMQEKLAPSLKEKEKILGMEIKYLGFSGRVNSILERAQLKYLGDLVQKTERDLLIHRNCGEKSVEEIDNFLSERGLRLGMSIETKYRIN
jgi:hypothetical protein